MTLNSVSASLNNARSYIELAWRWEAKERYKKAIEAYDQAVTILYDVPETQHKLLLASCFQELGHLWRLLGNNRYTGSYYKQSLDLYLCAHGDSPHEDTATAYYLLGSFLVQIWKLNPGIAYLTQALRLMTACDGDQHAYSKGIKQKLDEAVQKQVLITQKPI